MTAMYEVELLSNNAFIALLVGKKGRCSEAESMELIAIMKKLPPKGHRRQQTKAVQDEWVKFCSKHEHLSLGGTWKNFLDVYWYCNHNIAGEVITIKGRICPPNEAVYPLLMNQLDLPIDASGVCVPANEFEDAVDCLSKTSTLSKVDMKLLISRHRRIPVVQTVSNDDDDEGIVVVPACRRRPRPPPQGTTVAQGTTTVALSGLNATEIAGQLASGGGSVTFVNVQAGATHIGAVGVQNNNPTTGGSSPPEWAKKLLVEQSRQGQEQRIQGGQLREVHEQATTAKKVPASASRYTTGTAPPEPADLASAFESNSSSPKKQESNTSPKKQESPSESAPPSELTKKESAKEASVESAKKEAAKKEAAKKEAAKEASMEASKEATEFPVTPPEVIQAKTPGAPVRLFKSKTSQDGKASQDAAKELVKGVSVLITKKGDKHTGETGVFCGGSWIEFGDGSKAQYKKKDFDVVGN